MLKKYEDYRWQDIIEDEYIHLCGRAMAGTSEYLVPSIFEVIEETWSTENINVKEGAVQDAIERGEHLTVYGLDKASFMVGALRGEIPGFEHPDLKVSDVQRAVYDYLNARYFCHFDFMDRLTNAPGGEVW